MLDVNQRIIVSEFASLAKTLADLALSSPQDLRSIARIVAQGWHTFGGHVFVLDSEQFEKVVITGFEEKLSQTELSELIVSTFTPSLLAGGGS